MMKLVVVKYEDRKTRWRLQKQIIRGPLSERASAQILLKIYNLFRYIDVNLKQNSHSTGL